MLTPPAPGAGILPPQQIFADVPPTDPFYPYVQLMSLLGITAGETAATPTSLALYGPTDPLTRGQAAVFVIRTLELAGFALPAGLAYPPLA